MLADKRKVRRADHPVGGDAAFVDHGGAVFHLADKAVFTDVKPRRYCRDELERVKLRLRGELNGARRAARLSNGQSIL